MTVFALLLCCHWASVLWAKPSSLDHLRQQVEQAEQSLQTINAPQAREQLNQLQTQLSSGDTLQAHTTRSLRASGIRMEACHALAVDARVHGRLREMAKWISIIRTEAWMLRQNSDQASQSTGAYWHLLTDMAEIRRLSKDLHAGQRASIDRLERFIQEQTRYGEPFDPVAMRLVDQVRLSLLSLWDQRGMSQKVCKLVGQMRKRDPQNAALKDFNYCQLLGRTFNVKLVLADGQTWDSREKRGHPVVIYFWPGERIGSQSKGPTHHDLWQQLRTWETAGRTGGTGGGGKTGALSKASGGGGGGISRGGAEVLLVDLSHARQSGLSLPAIAWPVYRQEEGQFSLTQLLGIATLPRVAVIDAQGRIKAIGGPGIGDELDQILGN